MINKIKFIVFASILLLLVPSAFAASISITQSGADAGTVMLSKPFTVTVSGATANAQATITLPTGFALSGESATKTTNNNGVVSWTTVTANQQLSAQTISVSISGQGSPETVTSSSFSVIIPPSLSAVVTPASASVTQGSTFSISLNIVNSGETTARFGTITVSPSFFSISSGCSPSSISGSQSAGVSCGIAASTSASAGAQILTVAIAPSNADTLTKTVSVNIDALPSAGSPVSAITGQSVLLTITDLPKVSLQIGKVTITGLAIAVGKPTTVDIDKTEDVAFRKIIIYSTNAIKNAQISITKLADKPANITQEITGEVYHYIEVDKNISDVNIEQATIRFEVKKSWIDANNVNKSTVALYRYSNSAWNKLQTTEISGDANTVLYEAASTGLSVFAISGQAVSPPEQLPAEEKESEEEKPIISSTSYIYVLIAIVLSIIVIAIFVIRNKIKGKSKISGFKKFPSQHTQSS